MLVNDALAVLAGLEEFYPEGEGLDERASQLVALLALIAGQDRTGRGSDGRWRTARYVAPDRVISVVDPDTGPRRDPDTSIEVLADSPTALGTLEALEEAGHPR